MCFLKTDDRVRRFCSSLENMFECACFFQCYPFVSVLGLAPPTFLLRVFFSKDTLSILEIIIGFVLIVFYLKLFSKIRNSKIAILTYWCISISTLIIFFLIDLKLVIHLSSLHWYRYMHLNINRFNKFRDFLLKVTWILWILIKCFDGIFCGILIYFCKTWF